MSRLISIIMACNNLRDVDILLTTTAPTKTFRTAWAALAFYLGTQRLDTLRVKLECTSNQPVPISFAHVQQSSERGLTFGTLRNSLALLQIEITGSSESSPF